MILIEEDCEPPPSHSTNIAFVNDGHRFFFVFDLVRAEELAPLLEEFVLDQSLPFCMCHVDQMAKIINELRLWDDSVHAQFEKQAKKGNS